MKIAVLPGPRQFEIIEEPIPPIKPDEVLLQVAACGVCSSDLPVWKGDNEKEAYPRFLGHEVSGIVKVVGEEVEALKPGDPVGVWVVERGYAEYVAVKAGYCFPAGNVPLDLVLSEPLACAVNAVELADVALGEDVVIIGAGFMGNLVQKLVSLRGPRHLVVADIRQDALDRAERLGANLVVNLNTHSLRDKVAALTGGRGADVSFEVTGVQPALDVLGEVTRMSGKVVIVGFHQGQRQIPLGYWNWMAFQILNAHFRDIPKILQGMHTGMRLLTSGGLSLADMVSHRFSLDEINQAFQVASEKPEGFVKSTIVMV